MNRKKEKSITKMGRTRLITIRQGGSEGVIKKNRTKREEEKDTIR